MIAGRRVLVTGGAGFLGRYVCGLLAERGAGEVIAPRRAYYDLTRQRDAERLFENCDPEIVIHLAADVGGIGANMAHPGLFFYANMAMGMHLVEAARRHGVRKFVHAGTVCAYPKHCPVPFREDDLWVGYPEETNAPYGVAKKALFVMLDGYRREYGLRSAVVLPANLYGPGDDFDAATSHVIPAMIRRFDEARINGLREVVCWGSGNATREFLHAADAAEGIVLAAEKIDDPLPINLGSGVEVSISALAEMVASACGYAGSISWDASRPDGQPRRCLDTSRAQSLLGWVCRRPLDEGIAETVRWWRSNRDH